MNHNSAPLEIREKVAFTESRLEEALREGCARSGASELVILSTCNRTELFVAYDGDVDCVALGHWLARFHGLAWDDLAPYCYQHVDLEAVRHLTRVGAGLDSMVLGEPQILGQIKTAYAQAQQLNVVGSQLNQMFDSCFTVVKQIRTETAIGANPVSVAFAAVSLSKRIFSRLDRSNALLIGAGETIELVARHLRENGIANMTIANRTLSRSESLAAEVGARSVSLDAIAEELVAADIVISSTAAPIAILGKGAVEAALRRRKHKPIFMVDIAVPRDIEPQVAELSDVYLYTVDDLKEIVEENKRSRQSEAVSAEQLVEQGVLSFEQKQREYRAVDTVKALRSHADDIRQSELQRALKLLARGDQPEVVLESLARSLTNKLLHAPSANLKRASAAGRDEVIPLADELFALGEYKSLDSENT
ncbi:glutamyl-tRNA reductase [Sinobacterium caligoides]|uniref:glutamyl-tRNA reductase n=1 Tax=Sinobacterium caligoides TaxID=933926 RepID=UPI001FE93F87|nr:glutamyl-tRNA reductase [Sinobacterium caligoides]